MTKTLEPLGPEGIVEFARGIVTGELLIADLSDRAWQTSLALMMSSIAEYSNVTLILVPKAPHINIHWINNTAPGCTFSCKLVAVEDLPALEAEIERMHAALYPDQAPPQETMES